MWITCEQPGVESEYVRLWLGLCRENSGAVSAGRKGLLTGRSRACAAKRGRISSLVD